MAAYFIAHRREILDPEGLKNYAKGINRTIERFGGKVVIRADGFEVLEGEWEPGAKRDDSHPERLTVIEFPDIGSLRAWYDSPDYAPLKEIRQKSAVSDIAAVEGKPI